MKIGLGILKVPFFGMRIIKCILLIDHTRILARQAVSAYSQREILIEFARREIAATIGLDSGARFFLVGNVFKCKQHKSPIF
ncbi:protein of unknown function [Maridesulfovibrio hydrothermalis AM13 = DSM 14728]|uniref:Uncharacterized protein n=1 Tax=Maridesulfovibrio hydrothermalis AM13 = DSM 14728 TaxID=1121451 RepID=L0R9I1_9BACT|nr:protein of unknown function [Maridesulfovibrio hydrothermalis AM13 = DSM 14728]